MKANELMIEDWVLDGKNIAQIVMVTCDGIIETTFNESSNIELIEPIQLTPEILVKNGFSDESRHCHGEPLRYCVLVDGLWIDINGKNYFEGKLE